MNKRYYGDNRQSFLQPPLRRGAELSYGQQRPSDSNSMIGGRSVIPGMSGHHASGHISGPVDYHSPGFRSGQNFPTFHDPYEGPSHRRLPYGAPFTYSDPAAEDVSSFYGAPSFGDDFQEPRVVGPRLAPVPLSPWKLTPWSRGPMPATAPRPRAVNTASDRRHHPYDRSLISRKIANKDPVAVTESKAISLRTVETDSKDQLVQSFSNEVPAVSSGSTDSSVSLATDVAAVEENEETNQERVAREIEITVPADLILADYCKLCDAPLTGPESAKLHYLGKRHKQKENQYIRKVYAEMGIDPTRFLMPATGGEAPQPKPKKEPTVDPSKFKFTCFLCNVSFESMEQVQSHVHTMQHLTKIQQYKQCMREGRPFPTTKSAQKKAGKGPAQEFYCNLCDKRMNSPDQYDMHVASKKHQAKERRLELEASYGAYGDVADNEAEELAEETSTQDDYWDPTEVQFEHPERYGVPVAEQPHTTGPAWRSENFAADDHFDFF